MLIKSSCHHRHRLKIQGQVSNTISGLMILNNNITPRSPSD